MKKYLLPLLFITTLFLISACEVRKKNAFGDEDEIFVFADSSEYVVLEETLKDIFEVEIITPQPEKLFKLRWMPFDSFDIYKIRKNIIVISPLDSENKVTKFMTTVLDSAALASVTSGETNIINKKDWYRMGQLFMFLTAPTMQELEFELLRQRDNLLYSFQTASDDRLKKAIYNPLYEREEAEGKLLKDYGWTIFVQADFVIAKEIPDDNFVWLRRGVNTDAERWIFVHWIENANAEYLNIDSIKAIRNRTTEKYYRTSDNAYYVTISEEELNFKEVNFNGRYGLMTQGLWYMTDKFMGGPFVNYIFLDENTNRIYMVDGSIFAPKFTKRNLIQQIDVMLQSFRTKADLTKERVEYLLDEAEDYEWGK